MVNSRVGAKTTALSPSPRLTVSSRGTINDRDLPEPVSASTIASLLYIRNGMAYIWTGVGLS